MPSNRDESKARKRLWFRFCRAMDALVDTEGSIHNAVTKINPHLPGDLRLSGSTVSKLVHQELRPEYVTKNGIKKFQRRLSIIDPILMTIYDKTWSPKQRTYVQKRITPTVATDPERLFELKGYWRCFSWDASLSSEGSTAPESNYAHRFKMQIESPAQISCKTQHTVFNSRNNQMFIIENRVVIEVTDKKISRKAVFMAPLGKPDAGTIASMPEMFINFLDSGEKRVRAGTALMQRITAPEYVALTCESIPYTHKDITPELLEKLNFLRGKLSMLTALEE